MTSAGAALLARFRSRDRDAQADDARLGPLAVALSAALASLEAEQAGLDRRLADLRDAAGDLLGNDDGPPGEREGPVERDLLAAERRLMVATGRLARLATARTLLDRIEALVAEARLELRR